MKRLSLAAFVLSAVLASTFALAGPPDAKPPHGKSQGEPKETSGATQESVASKTAKFGVIAASDPAVKKALSCKDLAGGMKLVDKKGGFTGAVVDVHDTTRGNLYINFAKNWKETLSGHLAAASFAKFPSMKTLIGKRVLLSGPFSAYHGEHPQIELTSPAQIKIIK